MFLLKNNCVAYLRNPYESFFCFVLWKMIVSQTRESVFALNFENLMCHRSLKPPRNPREIFLRKICKCRKHYLLWIFSILMCVRDMFSHKSVNFKLKIAFQFHPQMKFGFSSRKSSILNIFRRSKKVTSFIKLCDFCCSYIAFWNFWLWAYFVTVRGRIDSAALKQMTQITL